MAAHAVGTGENTWLARLASGLDDLPQTVFGFRYEPEPWRRQLIEFLNGVVVVDPDLPRGITLLDRVPEPKEPPQERDDVSRIRVCPCGSPFVLPKQRGRPAKRCARCRRLGYRRLK